MPRTFETLLGALWCLLHPCESYAYWLAGHRARRAAAEREIRETLARGVRVVEPPPMPAAGFPVAPGVPTLTAVHFRAVGALCPPCRAVVFDVAHCTNEPARVTCPGCIAVATAARRPS